MSGNSPPVAPATDGAATALSGSVRRRDEDDKKDNTPSDKEGSEKDTEEQSSKRARVSDATAGYAPAADTATGVLSSENCAICLEGAAEGRALMDHCCPQCTQGAWLICEPCNDAILSRRCPICHGDYKPIEFHAFLNPDLMDSDLAGLAVAAVSRVKVSVIAATNAMIWTPSSNQLSFSLPVDASVPKRDIQYLRSTITASAEDLVSLREGVFSFTNKVWDSLEAAEDATEQNGVREMLAWVLQALADSEAVLFTPLTKEQQLELLRETLRSSLGGEADHTR